MKIGLKIRNRKALGASTGVLLVAVLGASTVFTQFAQDSVYADSINSTDFVTTWKTDNPGETNSSSITIVVDQNLNYTSTPYNYDVDWDNDGNFDETGLTGTVTHDFGTPGTYTIRMRGEFPRLFNTFNGTDTQKLVSVDQWGDIEWQNMNYSFAMPNLEVNASDAPDLSSVANAVGMFAGASKIGNGVSNWDVSNVTDMAGMFRDVKIFEADISNWNVGNVVNMYSMFAGTDAFNSDISQWNVSKVTNMSSMFHEATSFNQPLNDWDVSSVKDMTGMFTNASAFNQSLNNWDTTSVEQMRSMFSGATSFNQPLNDWDVSSVKDMQYMFYYANVFNQPLNDWDVSNVTSMLNMFAHAWAFNQPLSNWDTSSVTTTEGMFYNASAFNQPLSHWSMTNVTSIDRMFYAAEAFNSDISNWDTSNITNMFGVFWQATSFNQDISNWNVSSATDMQYMFSETDRFNHPLNSWDVSNVTQMSSMFARATAFNQPLSNWDVSSVTNMSGMFSGAESFNGDIQNWNVSDVTNMESLFSYTSFNQLLSNWDVSSVTNMRYMFYNADTFNQPLDSWDVSNVVSMEYMLDGATAFSSVNYDAMLSRWSQLDLQEGVALSNGPNYCLSSSSRQSMIDDFNWTIQDKGRACGTMLINDMKPESYDPIVLSGDQPRGASIGTLTVNGFAPSGFSISCTQASSDDNLFAISGNKLITASSISSNSSQDSNGDGIYQTCVRAFDASGRSTELIVYVKIVGPKIVTSIEFLESGNQKVLVVNGNLLSDPAEVNNALWQSMVRLNGTDLRFCSQGFGMSAEEIVAAYDISPSVVTDTPPCYELIKDGVEITFTQNQVRVYLPDSFDITAPGTISVNDSNTYTFNSSDQGGGEPGEENRTPTAFVNSGNGSLKGAPTIDRRPTFSGTATPGARIRVTVHSDPVSCNTVADTSGNWSCTLPSKLDPGVHTAYIRVVNPDGTVENLGPYKVRVGSGVATVTSETPLAPNTGFMSILQDMQSKKANDKNIAHILAAVAGGAFVLLIAYVMRQRKLARF